jgi:hypothetical protein
MRLINRGGREAPPAHPPVLFGGKVFFSLGLVLRGLREASRGALGVKCGAEEGNSVPFGVARGCGCALAFGRAVRFARVGYLYGAPRLKPWGYQPVPFKAWWLEKG